MALPTHVRKILWDVDSRAVDTKKHRSFLIVRVAEKGGWADVRWLKKAYGVAAIKRIVARSRNTSLKTKNFWRSV